MGKVVRSIRQQTVHVVRAAFSLSSFTVGFLKDFEPVIPV